MRSFEEKDKVILIRSENYPKYYYGDNISDYPLKSVLTISLVANNYINCNRDDNNEYGGTIKFLKSEVLLYKKGYEKKSIEELFIILNTELNNERKEIEKGIIENKKKLLKFPVGSIVKSLRSEFIPFDVKGLVTEIKDHSIEIINIERNNHYNNTYEINLDELKYIEIDPNFNKFPTEKGVLFLPVKTMSLNGETLEKERLKIMLLPDIDQTAKENDFLYIITKNLKTNYPEYTDDDDLISLGSFIFRIDIKDNTLKVARIEGGYKDDCDTTDFSIIYNPFMEYYSTEKVVIENLFNKEVDFCTLCFGGLQNVAKELLEKENYSEVINIAIKTLKDDSSKGYVSIEDFLEVANNCNDYGHVADFGYYTRSERDEDNYDDDEEDN